MTRPPPLWADEGYPAPPRRHILIVNGRKVADPVFILGAPRSGTELVGAALKRSTGFHLTLGQRWVLPVVQAFARSPSMVRGRPDAAAAVLRDAFAQGWQVSAACCLGCSSLCRDAGGVGGSGPCVVGQTVSRYGDASPDLLYCADSLVDAFPDARMIQVIRDGRDVAAAMLSDTEAMNWFRDGFVDLETEVTHPLLGVENYDDLAAWNAASVTGKCALRWRGSVRLAARLRARYSASQLVTLRYEDMVADPVAAARKVSDFLGTRVTPLDPYVTGTVGEPGVWRVMLTGEQLAEIEALAGPELSRIGYRE
jgi:hypothetical protein